MKRKNVLSQNVERLFDFIGEMVGAVALIVVAFMYINGQFKFLTNVKILGYLNLVREYTIIIAVVCCGMELASKSGFIGFILFLTVATVVVIFSFLPNVRDQIVSFFTNTRITLPNLLSQVKLLF